MHMTAPILTKFGENLRKFRQEKNMSQEDLGFAAGIHRTYVGSVERGEQNVSLINLEKLAKALKLRMRDLFDF